MLRSSLYGQFIVLCILTAVNVEAKPRYVIDIINIRAEILDETILTNLNTWLQKINRRQTAFSINATILVPLKVIPLRVETIQKFGVELRPMPLNITGEACKFLDTDYLIVKDIKPKMNIKKCPLQGDFSMTNVIIDPEHMPPMLLTGYFIIRVSFYQSHKMIARGECEIKIERKLN